MCAGGPGSPGIAKQMDGSMPPPQQAMMTDASQPSGDAPAVGDSPGAFNKPMPVSSGFPGQGSMPWQNTQFPGQGQMPWQRSNFFGGGGDPRAGGMGGGGYGAGGGMGGGVRDYLGNMYANRGMSPRAQDFGAFNPGMGMYGQYGPRPSGGFQGSTQNGMNYIGNQLYANEGLNQGGPAFSNFLNYLNSYGQR